jgi:hypothetical protein
MICDLFADSHSILNGCKNYFCKLLNVHGVNDVRQTKMHIAEAIVSEHTAIEKLNIYKSPGTDQNMAELTQAGGNTLHSEIHKLEDGCHLGWCST